MHIPTILKTSLALKRLVLLASCIASLFIINYPVSAQQTKQVSPAGTKFWLYLPPSYIPGTPSPLLVSLHGAGTIGNDLDSMLIFRDELPAKLIKDNKWPAQRPFIVLTPQMKRDPSVPNRNDQIWEPALVNEVIEYVKANWSIDINRIYFTGFSLGGNGVWRYATEYPTKIAAMVPMSGVTDTTSTANACLLKDIPTWAFHGAADGQVMTRFTVWMVNAINACSGRTLTPQLSLLEARRHEGWNEVYDGSATGNTEGTSIYDWMLKFAKNNANNKTPYVSAGADLKFASGSPVYLYGEYFDTDGSIASVNWTQLSGPSVTIQGANTRFPSISSPPIGSYEFQLTATDDDGATSSDRVIIQIVTPPSTLVVTGMTLINGVNDADIGPLSDGYVISPTALGTTHFNIRAVHSGDRKSLRFSVNQFRHTHTTHTFTHDLQKDLVIQPAFGGSQPDWVMKLGEYRVCATPYSENNAGGTQGVTLCYKLIVSNNPVVTAKTFYAKPGQDISQLSSWGENTDGTGNQPTSFTAEKQTFNITSSVVSTASPLAVSGNESSLWLRSGGSITVNHQVTNLNAEAGSNITINTNQPVTFGSMTGAHVTLGASAQNIPSAQYGNLIIDGAGSTKTLPSGNLIVTGNLTIKNDVVVNGASNNTSVVALSGNLVLEENGTFDPATKFGISFQKGAPQDFNTLGIAASFSQFIVSSNTTLQLNGPVTKTSLSLGSAAGGGLIIQNNGKFMVKNNTINIVGQGSLNNGNEAGQLGFTNGSSLYFNSTTTSNSHLYTVQDADSLSVLSVGLSGASAQLNVQDTVFITDSVKSLNGTINSNGFLTLVSEEQKTARIASIEGTGVISGQVQFQRFIPKARLYRYVSFPVAGVRVADVQQFVPVTGNFTGASTGPGLSGNPSLFHYQEPAGWVTFPQTNNQETFLAGKGYSLFIRDTQQHTKMLLNGAINQGNFSFTLTNNPTANSNLGWNLVGNPYASPILWDDESGWLSSGMNGSVYVRDNVNGRSLVWDGTVGDIEFAGIIPQGQAFWVRTVNATPSLTIQETAKVESQGRIYRTKATPTTVLSVELKHQDLIDRTYIKLREGGSDQHDVSLDAVKQLNTYFNISSLSTDSVSLAINNITRSACNKQIGLKIDAKEKGPYSLTFRGTLLENSNAKIYLIDHFSGKTTQVKMNDRYDYSITDEAGSSSQYRFHLRFEGAMEKPHVITEGAVLISSYEEGNQWYLDGQPIDGATAKTYTPVKSGQYHVLVKSGGCEQLSDPISFAVTGLFETADKEIRIYPNPAKHYLHIAGETDKRSSVKYTILNPTGAELLGGHISSEDFFRGVDINISSLSPGIYIFRVLERDRWHHFKVIVE